MREDLVMARDAMQWIDDQKITNVILDDSKFDDFCNGANAIGIPLDELTQFCSRQWCKRDELLTRLMTDRDESDDDRKGLFFSIFEEAGWVRSVSRPKYKKTDWDKLSPPELGAKITMQKVAGSDNIVVGSFMPARKDVMLYMVIDNNFEQLIVVISTLCALISKNGYRVLYLTNQTVERTTTLLRSFGADRNLIHVESVRDRIMHQQEPEAIADWFTTSYGKKPDLLVWDQFDKIVIMAQSLFMPIASSGRLQMFDNNWRANNWNLAMSGFVYPLLNKFNCGLIGLISPTQQLSRLLTLVDGVAVLFDKNISVNRTSSRCRQYCYDLGNKKPNSQIRGIINLHEVNPSRIDNHRKRGASTTLDIWTRIKEKAGGYVWITEYEAKRAVGIRGKDSTSQCRQSLYETAIAEGRILREKKGLGKGYRVRAVGSR